MTALSNLLDTYRNLAVTEREKGTYFEELIACYLRNEATYRDLYETVWTHADWARSQGLDGRDTGIDLVAKTRGTGEIHAIQCKLYAPTYRLRKDDIDSFFTASGKRPFAHRIIVSTTNHWSEHAEDALQDQQPPVSKIDLHDLENSQIDWARYQPNVAPALKAKKTLREHQSLALERVERGFQGADRGKLIMACGTGKTFTSLKIAEKLAGRGARVLFLVPSLSLLSQTLTEWTQESDIPLHSFAVCSDSDVGKKRRKGDDEVKLVTHELRYPATTNARALAVEMKKRHDADHMSVVFSTYHSIATISDAQSEGLPEFDLVVCDEAHRTTGATFEGSDESAFVKVHDGAFIRAKRRLYMTATPRIYGNSAKATAERDNVALCSMDDESLFGREFHVITFSEAVKLDLLVDYKVIVLAVDENHVNRRLQSLLKDENNQLKVDDASKIVGCWKALAKLGLEGDLVGDDLQMKRAVAFCQVIEPSDGKTHKVSSKTIKAMFQRVVEEYQAQENIEPGARMICEAEHVDGGMNASEKEAKLTWLKSETPENTCRILSNVRCLSEGVDVPALDAVLFLTPRNSQIDVVQSVGRVMRKSEGKKRGYVVLPVVIPAGVESKKALDDNKNYAVVWQVLQALRSHDDRFDAMVNKLDLIGKDTSKMEVIAITDRVASRQAKTSNVGKAKGEFKLGQAPMASANPEAQHEMRFEIGEIERAIYAKLVAKVGNRHHWEDWATDIAKIAQTHIDRIKIVLADPANTDERSEFANFSTALRSDLNDGIKDDEVVEMLAQHLITKPVFEALFENFPFASGNPISKAMERMVVLLEKQHLEKEADTLKGFYDSVKMRAQGIDSAQGKQKIIVELYDKFFKNAFPKMTERLGIVYTPVEVVDFIVHSVDQILRREFGQSLASEGVHILDPFTGTGTFITRLLQSGLIPLEDLPRKFAHEIHANEIVLLAYYISAINIEATYHGLVGGEYQPFEGICLTDTFHSHAEDLADGWLATNNKRRKRQDRLDIRVIIGNPPYSVGQKSENDNNSNLEYLALDERIRKTYALASNAQLSKGLYDSYVRAIRWASDRIGDSGVVGFVTNAGFLDTPTFDGLRKCLSDEFASLYIFHLRGNQRTSGELSRKEGGKIFGSGSRAPVAISLLVKNPKSASRGVFHFHDIGDYLTQQEKLDKISAFAGVDGISNADAWRVIPIDEHGDWLKQRDERFSQYMPLGSKEKSQVGIFQNFSLGVVTARDVWCFNPSKSSVSNNMRRMIDFYNEEVVRYQTHVASLPANERPEVDDFVQADARQISWTRSLKQDLKRGKKYAFVGSSLIQSVYRPFNKEWLYFNRRFNEMVYQMPRIYPDATAQNLVIGVSASASRGGYSVLMFGALPSLHATDMVGSQYYPLHLYEDPSDAPGLFPERKRRDAISDEALDHYLGAYPGETITKEDVFYYIYGVLQSPDYHTRFGDNLAKELPRIPCVKMASDFWHFSKAGRALGNLHVNFEQVPMFPAKLDTGNKVLTDADYRVEKMRFGGKGREKDRSTVVYNDHITITGIPLEAYDYVVNGKPALDWVIERQRVKPDPDSGIIKDANDWATETMNNPRYPLELFLRVVTVSLETMKIIHSLPALDIDG